jgi:hypothetical protein
MSFDSSLLLSEIAQADIQPPSHPIKCLQTTVSFFQLIRQGQNAALFLPLLHPGDVNEHAQGLQIRPKQGFEAPQTRKGVHELQVSIDASFSLFWMFF